MKADYARRLIRVTAKHIRDATRLVQVERRDRSCPIALALADAGLPASVYAGKAWFHYPTMTARVGDLSPRARKFIERFDNPLETGFEPFNFYISPRPPKASGIQRIHGDYD